MSSKRYRYGTPHLRDTTLPAYANSCRSCCCRGDDAADQPTIVLVVEKGDDLSGVATVVDVRGCPAAAVRGQYQDVRFVDLDALVQRYPRGGNTQLLHEAVGVSDTLEK